MEYKANNLKLAQKATGIMLSFLILAGCSTPLTAQSTLTETVDVKYTVSISPVNFVEVVDNPYFPVLIGAKYVYEGNTENGVERIEIEVLPESRTVMGIRATVLHDIVFLNGQLVEDTYDWYAQDKDGNVWYLGEDVKNYENGQLRDTAGSWEAGIDGALPGIIMYANPAERLGEVYRQEYYKGKAEDMAELLSANESVSVPYGSFENVIQTKDYTPLEPELLEHKYYAKGIGMVKEIDLNTGEEVVLIDFIAP
jgi:hypothetical protein